MPPSAAQIEPRRDINFFEAHLGGDEEDNKELELWSFDERRPAHQAPSGGGRAHPLGHHDLASPPGVVAFPVGHPRARSAAR